MMTDPASVLLVDDQPINLHAARYALVEAGYRVLVARDGQRAIAIAEAQTPDLILLDVVMPGMDGFTTCRMLKQKPATRAIPVIFLTARAAEEDITEGFDAGGVDYITKPFQLRELLARVKVHIDLMQAHRHLHQLNRSKSEFLAMAAHDLKNPLHSIIGFSELLRMDLEAGQTLSADDGETMELLETMERTSNHMFRLIHDLLESESIDSGRVELHPELCDLDSVTVDLLALNQPHAAQKQIALEYEPQQACIAVVDRRAIREAFDNLINNAIKYCSAGATVRITLTRHEPTADRVCFAVHDTGPGLSREDLNQAFQRFQKLSARPTGGEVSSGLGLSIVKTLVEQQGGTVTASSPGKGRGSTFSIVLPLAELDEDNLAG